METTTHDPCTNYRRKRSGVTRRKIERLSIRFWMEPRLQSRRSTGSSRSSLSMLAIEQSKQESERLFSHEDSRLKVSRRFVLLGVLASLWHMFPVCATCPTATDRRSMK